MVAISGLMLSVLIMSMIQRYINLNEYATKIIVIIAIAIYQYVLNKKITFVDFGLAEMRDNADNSENCERFISYLSILKKKFKYNKGLDRRHQLIFNFLNNKNI